MAVGTTECESCGKDIDPGKEAYCSSCWEGQADDTEGLRRRVKELEAEVTSLETRLERAEGEA